MIDQDMWRKVAARHALIARCNELRKRGLNEATIQDLKDVGDEPMVTQIEALATEQIAELNEAAKS